MSKHWESNEVVTTTDPYLQRGADGLAERLAKRLAEQQQAHEAEFPGAAAKREEIRRQSEEAEKRVNELVEAWEACEV